ncbi:MAG: DUF3800 domain-containing protein [Methanosarcinales archaeon]
MYIYLDESGDLGFSERSSRHFVIAIMAVYDKQPIENSLKKYRKKLRKKDRKIQEFKFNIAPPKIKKDILKIISNKEVQLGYAHVDKSKVYPKLRAKPRELYAYMVRRLLDKFLFEPANGRIDLVVDKHLPKKYQDNFDRYIGLNIQKMLEGIKSFNISHKNSQQELCLQAVDFVCGAVYRKYNFNEDEYFNIIKSLFVEKYDIFKK